MKRRSRNLRREGDGPAGVRGGEGIIHAQAIADAERVLINHPLIAAAAEHLRTRAGVKSDTEQ